MGLVWIKAESARFKQQLKGNLAVWDRGLRQWRNQIDDLETKLGQGPGVVLSGKAWNAAQTLFVDRIEPIVDAGLNACNWTKHHLGTYAVAELPLMGDTALRESSLQSAIDHLEQEIWNTPFNELDPYVRRLRDQVRTLQNKLADLRTFANTVEGLFNAEIAITASLSTAVSSIRNGTLRVDGSYIPASGDHENWRDGLTSYLNNKPPSSWDGVLNIPVILTGPVSTSDADMEPADIHQGNAGDCWYLAVLGSLAATAEGRDLLRANMVWNAQKGGYEVTLYRDGKPEVYFVDTIYSDGAGYGAETWVAVYEAALVQYYKGNAEKINGGISATGMEILTGKKAALVLLIDSTYTSAMLSITRQALANGSLVTAGSYPDIPIDKLKMGDMTVTAGVKDANGNWTTAQIGIVRNHAYTVEAMDDDYVYLRNPWGPNNSADRSPSGLIRLTWTQFRDTFVTVSVGKK